MFPCRRWLWKRAKRYWRAQTPALALGLFSSRASSRSDDLTQIPIQDLSQDFWEDIFCLKSQYRRQTVRALFEVVEDVGVRERDM